MPAGNKNTSTSILRDYDLLQKSHKSRSVHPYMTCTEAERAVNVTLEWPSLNI